VTLVWRYSEILNAPMLAFVVQKKVHDQYQLREEGLLTAGRIQHCPRFTLRAGLKFLAFGERRSKAS
jgi:hypothetical protein